MPGKELSFRLDPEPYKSPASVGKSIQSYKTPASKINISQKHCIDSPSVSADDNGDKDSDLSYQSAPEEESDLDIARRHSILSKTSYPLNAATARDKSTFPTLLSHSLSSDKTPTFKTANDTLTPAFRQAILKQRSHDELDGTITKPTDYLKIVRLRNKAPANKSNFGNRQLCATSPTFQRNENAKLKRVSSLRIEIDKPKKSTCRETDDPGHVGCNACDNAVARKTHDDVALAVSDLNPDLIEIDERLKQILEELKSDNFKAQSHQHQLSTSKSPVSIGSPEATKDSSLDNQPTKIVKTDKAAALADDAKKLTTDESTSKEAKKNKQFISPCCKWLKKRCCCC